MEKIQSQNDSDDFRLTAPPDELGELFMEAVLDDMDQPQTKRPLQCVTVKMPLPEYLRMKRATQRWNMTYTDVINFCTQRVIPILESLPEGSPKSLSNIGWKVRQREL